jgi:sugar lactone lactonase YvrE
MPRRSFAVAIFLLYVAGTTAAQSILTVAGGGPIGDGKVATQAILRSPREVAFDSEGNLYIADELNHRVRKVDAKTGKISTYAGGGTSGLGDGGPATAAELSRPRALAMDKPGNLFISSLTRIRRVDRATGIITTYAGSENWGTDPVGRIATDAVFFVEGLAFDVNGDLLFSDYEWARVFRISAVTRIVTVVAGNGSHEYSGDGGPATAAGVWAEGLALDRASNIYIADGPHSRVRRIDGATGVITTYAGNGIAIGDPDFDGPAKDGSIIAPTGLAFDSDGNLFIASRWTGVYRVDAATQNLRRFAGGGTAGAEGKPARQTGLAEIEGITFHNGDLYIAERGWGRIRRVEKTTTITTTVAGGADGGDGLPATAAQLNSNEGIAIDRSGNIYVADRLHHRVRRVDSGSSKITTVAGNGLFMASPEDVGAATDPLPSPTSLALDSSENLYIGNQGFVRKLDKATAKISTLVRPGTPLEGGADAIGEPHGLVVAPNGDVYFADGWHHRVRKYEAATGKVITVAGIGPNQSPDGPNPGGYSGDGGLAVQAQLNSPKGVALDSDGNVYIGDSGNSMVRVVDRQGIIRKFAGDQNWFNSALGVDAQNNVYTSILGAVIKIDRQTRAITRVAGTREEGFSGDNGPAVWANW